MGGGTRLFGATVFATDVDDAGAPPGWRDCTLRDPAGDTVRVMSQPS